MLIDPTDVLASAISFFGYRWCVVTELNHDGRMLGFVAIFSNAAECPFTSNHQVVLAVVTNQASSAVAHARLRALNQSVG